VASAPFDALLMLTGKKAWDLDKSEREDMGEAIAMTLQFWSGVDPKWLALANLIGTMGSVAAAHWVLYRTEVMRDEAAKLAKVA
jgi:hypothetical protein